MVKLMMMAIKMYYWFFLVQNKGDNKQAQNNIDKAPTKVIKLDKTKRKTSNSKRIHNNPLMIEPEMIGSKRVNETNAKYHLNFFFKLWI